jgi:methylated-DNA-[protein]-cysteine S-methyltransferase
MLIDRVETALGGLLVVADGARVCAVEFEDCRGRMLRLLRARYGDPSLREADDPQGFSSRLRAYFAGRCEALDDIPIEPGGTPFQRGVWSALRRIPAGTTASYAGLAAKLGVPSAYRAVARANALNPIALVVPCHRLLGAHGALIGYAGGLHRKRWLLQHEAGHRRDGAS